MGNLCYKPKVQNVPFIEQLLNEKDDMMRKKREFIEGCVGRANREVENYFIDKIMCDFVVDARYVNEQGAVGLMYEYELKEVIVPILDRKLLTADFLTERISCGEIQRTIQWAIDKQHGKGSHVKCKSGGKSVQLNITWRRKKTMLVFDFDGVLRVNPEEGDFYYPQIPELLKELAKDHILCIASYNPKAIQVLKDWGFDKYFTCMRAGCNYKWFDVYGEHYRENLCKAEQISDMIENEVKDLKCGVGDIWFFDDVAENIEAVRRKLPKVKTVLVDDKVGFMKTDYII